MSNYEPVGLSAVRPHLIVSDGNAAIEFYRSAFEGEELERFTESDGRVSHAKVRIGDTILELGETPEAKGRAPREIPDVGLRLYVTDLDATYARAVAAGATGVAPPAPGPIPSSRAATIYDPFGLTWWLAMSF